MLIHEGTEGFPSLSVLHANAGTIAYPPGSMFGPRQQMNYQLLLLHTGRADIEIDGEARTLKPGQVALLKPGHREMYRFATDAQTWHQWIHLRAEPGSAKDAAELEQLPFALPLKEPIARLTDQMLSAEQSLGGGEGSPLLRALGLSALLQYIAESQLQEQQRSLHPAVLSTQQAMRHRLTEPLTLQLLAEAVHVSPEHLVRLFRRDLGMTPIRWLWKLRLERGLALLRATGLPVGEIAQQSGFQTSYHFARTIKEETGLTPTEVRLRSLRGE